MEPADSHRYSLIVPEGGEQEQDWMWFAPFGDAFSLLLVVRRFHDLRSFHQRLLKVGPLRGPEVICETRVLYKAFAPSGRRAKCDDTQGDALGYELLPLQGVWGKPKGCSRISMPVLISSFSEFPPAEARWPLILALQKDPLTKGGKLCLTFL